MRVMSLLRASSRVRCEGVCDECTVREDFRVVEFTADVVKVSCDAAAKCERFAANELNLPDTERAQLINHVAEILVGHGHSGGTFGLVVAVKALEVAEGRNFNPDKIDNGILAEFRDVVRGCVFVR